MVESPVGPAHASVAGPLERGRSLWQQGNEAEALPWLEKACAGEAELGDGEAAEAWCLLGLLRAQQAQPRAAAAAFLRALAREPDCQLALRSLYFQRFADDDLRALLPQLDHLVRGGTVRASRASVVLADWHHRVGDRALARRVYRSLWGDAGDGGDAPAQIGTCRPDALLIGAPKCGTTSLMAALRSHPGVWCQPRKELHFFNNRWDWGLPWYAEQFPPRVLCGGGVRLEATPDYLQGPEIPERVAATLPGVKLIVLLREPLARALSWIHHQRRWGGLVGSPEAVIANELEVLAAMPAQALRQLGWRAPNALAASLYDVQLSRWRQHFGAEDLLILRAEDLFIHPQIVLASIDQFLHLEPGHWRSSFACPQMNRAPDSYPGLPAGLAQHCRQTVLRRAWEIWKNL